MIKQVILVLLSFLFIVGCGNITKQTEEPLEENINEQLETYSEIEEETVSDNRVNEETTSDADVNNYSIYLGNWKLTVPQLEELYRMTSMIEFFGSAGITITEVNGNNVSGKIHTVQGPPSYRQAEVEFSGEVVDGQLNTEYIDENWQNSGTIFLTFKEDVIEAKITRDESSLYSWGIPAGEFTFLRAIETDEIALAEVEKQKLEQFLLATNKDWLPSFADGELTDEAMINFVGINVALGTIDGTSFGEITEQNGNVIASENTLNNIAKYYFGNEILVHQSVDFITYDNGRYEIPLLGGVFAYPKLQVLLQDEKNKETYYAIVDYFFDHPETGTEREYQRYIKLAYEDYYIITSIKEINEPILFELIRPADYSFE